MKARDKTLEPTNALVSPTDIHNYKITITITYQEVVLLKLTINLICLELYICSNETKSKLIMFHPGS
jgi:hypothetical protein